MTKLAIPYFGSRVAPRLDGARSLLLLNIEDGKVAEKQYLPTISRTSADKLRLMRDQGVDVVICGGIDRQSLRILRATGMRLYSWITGEVEDAIELYLKGELRAGTRLDPHCRRQRHGRGAGRSMKRAARHDSI